MHAEDKMKEGKEVDTVKEITKMFDHIMIQMQNSDDKNVAIKDFAQFIKDLDEVAVARKHAFWYIYRDMSRMLEHLLVEVVLKVL